MSIDDTVREKRDEVIASFQQHQVAIGTLLKVDLVDQACLNNSMSSPVYLHTVGHNDPERFYVGVVCDLKPDGFFVTPGWNAAKQRVAEPGFTGGVQIYYECVKDVTLL